MEGGSDLGTSAHEGEMNLYMWEQGRFVVILADVKLYKSCKLLTTVNSNNIITLESIFKF
jgi:hypothetical protein